VRHDLVARGAQQRAVAAAALAAAAAVARPAAKQAAQHQVRERRGGGKGGGGGGARRLGQEVRAEDGGGVGRGGPEGGLGGGVEGQGGPLGLGFCSSPVPLLPAWACVVGASAFGARRRCRRRRRRRVCLARGCRLGLLVRNSGDGVARALGGVCVFGMEDLRVSGARARRCTKNSRG